MADLRKLRFDVKKANDGVWFDWQDGARLLIARAGNRRFREAQSRLLAPHLAEARKGTLDEKTSRELSAQALAEGVLLDWTGLEDGGAPLPYSKEKAAELLADEGLDIHEFVVVCSCKDAAYRAEREHEAAKN